MYKAGKNKITGVPNVADEGAVDLYITLKLSDIHDETGPVQDLSGSVIQWVRITLIDRAEDKVMTVFDFPTSFNFQLLGGKTTTKKSATEIINLLNQPALPACTTIELVSVVVRDQNGNDFAAIGTYLP